MKTITKTQNNVIECTCGTVIEYDKSDLILKGVEKTDYYAISVVCPACGKVHTVKPAEFDEKVLIGSVSGKKSLDEWTVKELSLAANSAYAKDIFAIHERRTITLKNGYNAVFEIIGINHDIREDGKKAGITFGLVDLYDKNDGGDRKMNEECTNVGGFEETAIFKWLNEDFFALLPDEWQEIIVPAVKKTANCGGSKAKIVDTTCKVFIPSEVEVFGQCRCSKKGEGEQYEGFKNWKNRVKGYSDGDYGCWYWLRSPYSVDNNYFCIVRGDGSCNYNFANYACGVVPCFAI